MRRRLIGTLLLALASGCYQSHELEPHESPEPPLARCAVGSPDPLVAIENSRRAAERVRFDEPLPLVATPRTGPLTVDPPRLAVFIDGMPWDETVNLQPPASSRHSILFLPHDGEPATIAIDDGWYRLETETSPSAFIATRPFGPGRPATFQSPFSELELEFVPTCRDAIDGCPGDDATTFALIAALPSGESVSLGSGETGVLGLESIHHAFSLESAPGCGMEPEFRAVVVLFGER